MARPRKMPKTRTRTVTKFKTRHIRERMRSFRSRHSSKVDHATTILTGVGAGALTSTVTQLLAKNTGFKYPVWLNPMIGGIAGLLAGKHVGHSWNRGVEAGIAGAVTAFAEDRVISGQPILNLNLGSSQQSIGGTVY